MEKRFLDQVKRRTGRSPFSERLPSRRAWSCAQRQQKKMCWAVKDGITHWKENNYKNALVQQVQHSGAVRAGAAG